jgi:hypothetical protein
MQQSETIGKLSEALSKVQAVLEGAKLDSTNPFFKSKYSDLTSVWAACRKPLAENGLSVIQTCQSETAEMVIVETMLCHNSGEWVRGRLAMRPVKADPQGVGSCITYARRYSLAAIVGVAPEDDDGNIASGKSDKPETRRTAQPKTETKASEKPPQETSPVQTSTKTAISDAQRKRLYAIYKGSGKTDEQMKEYLNTTFGIVSSKEITKENYEAICKWAETKMDSNMILCPELNYEVTKVDCQNCLSDNKMCEPYQTYLSGRQ